MSWSLSALQLKSFPHSIALYLFAQVEEGKRAELALGLISIATAASARESSPLCTHTRAGDVQLRNKFPAYIDTDFISFNASQSAEGTEPTDRQAAS